MPRFEHMANYGHWYVCVSWADDESPVDAQLLDVLLKEQADKSEMMLMLKECGFVDAFELPTTGQAYTLPLRAITAMFDALDQIMCGADVRVNWVAFHHTRYRGAGAVTETI